MSESTPIHEFGQFMSMGEDHLLIDTSDPRAQPLHKERLSPSTSNGIGNGCPARWAVEQLLPRDDDPMSPPVIGTTSHAVLEVLFNLRAADRTPTALAVILSRLADLNHEYLVTSLADGDRSMDCLNRALTDMPGPPTVSVPADAGAIPTWFSKVASYVSPIFAKIDPTAVEVIETERHLDNVSIAGVPVNGYIDLLAADGIKDWKFKGKKPRIYNDNSRFVQDYHEQIRIYVLALAAQDIEVASGELVYVNHEMIDSVDVSPSALAVSERRFVAAWETLHSMLGSGKFACKPSPLCGWCPLVTLCPTAIKAEKVPKSPQAELGPATNIRRTEGQDDIAEPIQESDVNLTDHQYSGKIFTGNPDAYRENRPYEGVPVDGYSFADTDLDPNSYGASGLSGHTGNAYRLLSEQGSEFTPDDLFNLSSLLYSVTHQVRTVLVGGAKVGGKGGATIHTGLDKHIRGHLYTFTEQHKPPFGDNAEVWRAWLNQAVGEVTVMIENDFKIYRAGMNPGAIGQIAQD